MPSSDAPYQRILLKLSGEALSAPHEELISQETEKTTNINLGIVLRIAKDIATVAAKGIQIGIVIGGGNWFRGVNGVSIGLARITSDHIGMLATLMNALVMRDILTQQGLEVRVVSAVPTGSFIEPFELMRVRRYLKQGRVVIFAGGIGHPFVSTDAAASLRALEIEADILLKATSVDGIYSEDPTKNPNAIRYTHLSYQEALEGELGVMDLAAFIQCRDYRLPIRVFNINTPHGLVDIVQGISHGTLVSSENKPS